MNYIKYIIFIFFVTSCSIYKLKIENKDIDYTINLIQTNPKSWETIVADTSITDLNDFFTNESNRRIIVKFYEHIKISKFDVINILNRYDDNSFAKLCDIVLGREGNEFNITFNFKYYPSSNRWKLINVQSKSLLIEEFKEN